MVFQTGVVSFMPSMALISILLLPSLAASEISLSMTVRRITKRWRAFVELGVCFLVVMGMD